MDEKFKQKWDYVIRKAALEAMKSKAKMYNEINGGTFTEDQQEQTFRAYKARLAKEYPVDSVSDADLSAISSFPADSMRTWLDQYGSNSNVKSPTAAAKAAKAADILPLLHGYAKEGKSWYDIPSDYLKEKGAKLGYNVRTKEGFKQFLDDIGEQQINFDRAKLVQEAKDLNYPYTLRKMLVPSTFQEFENAIATGGDFDEDDRLKYAALDIGTNMLIAGAPEVAPFKNAIANTVLNAALQAGGEAIRQEGKVLMSKNGQTFDVDPVLFTPVAGLTRPATVGVVQNAVAKIPGAGANKFARGFSRATREGDPVDVERNALEQSIKAYNSKLREDINTISNSGDDFAFIAPSNKYFPLLGSNKAKQTAELFDVPVVNGKIDTKKILSDYDKDVSLAFRQGPDGNLELVDRPLSMEGKILLNKSKANDYQRLLPARYSELSQGTGGAFKAGLVVGDLFNGIFGRVEPALKYNPFKLSPVKLFSRNSHDSDNKSYKQQPWYKNLKPTARKIIDEAFKEKSKEDEEE